MKKLIIKAGREKSLLRRHPWIFSGAIKNLNAVDTGDVVRVMAEDGRYLATAAVSAQSQIAARVLSFNESDVIDETFTRHRIAAAIAARKHIAGTDAVRLIHGESDGLPGVVADRYGDTVVLQLSTAAVDPQRNVLAKLLIEETGAATIVERSDSDVRKLEGLGEVNGHLAGAPLTDPIVITENGLAIEVDVMHGHKTGFYLDQRENRALTQALAADRDVLNCFCYTATMSVAAMAGGARSVMSVDSSGPALEAGRRIARLNGIDADRLERMEWMEADVFAHLRKLRDMGRQFDLIILDPPKLAPTAHHVEKAARAYKDINLLGFKLLRPGGLLMTYSCSGGVSVDLFQKIVAGAALDAGVEAQILKRLSAGVDHPVSVHFPEGEYLKGLLLRRG